MAYYRQRKGRLGTAFQPTVQDASIPASVGGVNALDSLMGMQATDCIYTYNLMPVEYGLRLRKGYIEWAEPDTAAGDVRTIIPYEAYADANNKMFAVTPNGIYDVSSQGTTAPWAEQVGAVTTPAQWTTTSGDAGWGVHVEYTDLGGDHWILYADEENGLFIYDTTTGFEAWVRPGDAYPVGHPNAPGNYPNWTYPAGTVPYGDVVFVTVHKQRVWFVLRDDDNAYYGGTAAIFGAFTLFTFGAKMPHAGDLRGIWTWTMDGGDGIDDYLIAVGRGGDLMVYQGYNPADQANWSMVGSWFIGEAPESRRLATNYGSEMYILSVFGITNLRDLLQGAAVNEIRVSPSAKINRFMRTDMEASKDFQGWAIEINPEDGFMQVILPAPLTGVYAQYNQNLNTKAWGFWENVPIICATTWDGDYFMGGEDGKIYIYDGEYDGTTYDGTLGTPIYFRTLTSFQPYGPHGTHKRVSHIRTIGILSSAVEFNVAPVYDYAIETSLPSTNPVSGATGATWFPGVNSGIWDADQWVGGPVAGSALVGTTGMGRVAAIAMNGNAADRINVIGWDLTYDGGWFL